MSSSVYIDGNEVMPYTISRSSVGLGDLHFKITDAFLEK